MDFLELDKLKEVLRPEDKDDIAKDIKFGKTVDMLVNKAKIK